MKVHGLSGGASSGQLKFCSLRLLFHGQTHLTQDHVMMWSLLSCSVQQLTVQLLKPQVFMKTIVARLQSRNLLISVQTVVSNIFSSCLKAKLTVASYISEQYRSSHHCLSARKLITTSSTFPKLSSWIIKLCLVQILSLLSSEAWIHY